MEKSGNMMARAVVSITHQSGGNDAVIPRRRQICRQFHVLCQPGGRSGRTRGTQFRDERGRDSYVRPTGRDGLRESVVRFEEADSDFRETGSGTEGRWTEEEGGSGTSASNTASATAPEVKTVNDFRPPEYRRAIVVSVMLNIQIGALHVTREGKGIRFTIPTMHSSTFLSQDETRQLIKMLTKEFKKKPQPDDGGV